MKHIITIVFSSTNSLLHNSQEKMFLHNSQERKTKRDSLSLLGQRQTKPFLKEFHNCNSFEGVVGIVCYCNASHPAF